MCREETAVPWERHHCSFGKHFFQPERTVVTVSGQRNSGCEAMQTA
jgi:hypothetical protein